MSGVGGEDAVHAAVIALRGIIEDVKSGRTLPQDSVLDHLEQTCMAVSHLRSGAGAVQTNVEALEAKVSEEVAGMKTAINEEAQKVREELSNTIGRFAATEAAITAITGELYQAKTWRGTTTPCCLLAQGPGIAEAPKTHNIATW